MPQTPRYKILRKRLSDLRRHMLPSRFSPTGSYRDNVQDRTRGYRLLVHAEIEAYFEEISKSVVIGALKKWKDYNSPSVTLIAFLASYHSSWNPDDKNIQEEVFRLAKNRKTIGNSAKEILDSASTQYSEILKSNNGIRVKNLQRILVPTGIDLSKLDNTWLTTLDDFGELRGLVAHTSAHTAADIDPKSEYDRVQDLLSGLKKLDSELFNYMK